MKSCKYRNREHGKRRKENDEEFRASDNVREGKKAKVNGPTVNLVHSNPHICQV